MLSTVPTLLDPLRPSESSHSLARMRASALNHTSCDHNFDNEIFTF